MIIKKLLSNIQERLTIVLEYERIKNKMSRKIDYLTPNQKLLNPHTKICKIYGVGVKLTIEDSLKENL